MASDNAVSPEASSSPTNFHLNFSRTRELEKQKAEASVLSHPSISSHRGYEKKLPFFTSTLNWCPESNNVNHQSQCRSDSYEIIQRNRLQNFFTHPPSNCFFVDCQTVCQLPTQILQILLLHASSPKWCCNHWTKRVGQGNRRRSQLCSRL